MCTTDVHDVCGAAGRVLGGAVVVGGSVVGGSGRLGS
jgi:hypothetical protein